MKLIWLAALLAVPAAHGALGLQQHADVTSASQEPFATLSSGGTGTADTGTSSTSADITVNTLPGVTAEDILQIASTDNAWTVHAELQSFTGFSGVLDSITLTLRNGLSTEAQIDIAAGIVLISNGSGVTLRTSQNTELTAIGTGSGSITFDLVIQPDTASGVELRYHCTLTVP